MLSEPLKKSVDYNFLSIKNIFFNALTEINYAKACYFIICIMMKAIVMFQCRKYKASDKVRNKAEFIYNKFKAVFLEKGENFAAVSSLLYCLLY